MLDLKMILKTLLKFDSKTKLSLLKSGFKKNAPPQNISGYGPAMEKLKSPQFL